MAARPHSPTLHPVHAIPHSRINASMMSSHACAPPPQCITTSSDNNTSADNVARITRTQSALHDLVRAVYTALDAHEPRARASSAEIARLRNVHAHSRQDAQHERDHLHQQLQQCECDLAARNEQLQVAQAQRVRVCVSAA